MPVNQFKIWSSASGGYSAAAYAALSDLTTGVVPGIADPLQANASWRQPSAIATMIAQFIVDNTGEDAVDDGTFATLLTNFTAALKTFNRIRLAADLDIFIATTGSDTPGNGLLIGSPFLTRQYAWDFVREAYDLNGHMVNFNLADGVYTDPFTATGQLLGQAGAAAAVFKGNVGTPTNVTFNIASSNIFNISAGANTTITGMLIGGVTGTGVTGNGIIVSNGGAVSIGDAIRFGTCGSCHIQVDDQGYVICSTAAYTISGNASNHIQCSAAVVNLGGSPVITISGTVGLTGAFYLVTNGGVIGSSASYVGSLTTGIQYDVTLNGVLNTGGGLLGIPGTTGTSASGGQAA